MKKNWAIEFEKTDAGEAVRLGSYLVLELTERAEGEKGRREASHLLSEMADVVLTLPDDKQLNIFGRKLVLAADVKRELLALA